MEAHSVERASRTRRVGSAERRASANSWYEVGQHLGNRAVASQLHEIIASSRPPGPLPPHLQQMLSGFEQGTQEEAVTCDELEDVS